VACAVSAISTTACGAVATTGGEIATIDARSGARHPQDGPHVDLRFRVDRDRLVVEVGMNLVFLDWMVETGRESPERIDPSELAQVGRVLGAYFEAQMPVEIDGGRVAPRVESLQLNDPDESLLPLFPLSGWAGLRKVFFHLVFPFPAKGPGGEAEPATTIAVAWPAYPPDVLSVLAAKPPLEIAAEWHADGLKSDLVLTRTEPGYTWHRPAGGIDGRLERVPMPPPPVPLVPGWAVLACGVFAIGYGGAAARRRSPRIALATGVSAAAVVLVLRPAAPFLAFGARAAPSIGDGEARTTFEALQANLYRAFDYETESGVYDALSRSVAGELLEETYLSVRRALVFEEEGGAMSRVTAVRPVATTVASFGEIELDGRACPAFVVDATWQVDGRVTHWGHAHDRTNEYDGRFVVAALPDGWRIADAEVTRQERIDGGGPGSPDAGERLPAEEELEL
jgi:hypothetical protein